MIRPYEPKDLDLCVDMYLDFADVMEHGDDDPWSENSLAERLKDILESPFFEGWVFEEGGQVAGFVLGARSTRREGKEFEVLELFTAQGRNIQATATQLLDEVLPHLKAKGYVGLGVLSGEPWDAAFFARSEFKEDPKIRYFVRPL
jgi:hypothetical protein